MCVSLFLESFTEERRGGGGDCFEQLWLPPPASSPPPRSSFFSPPPVQGELAPLPASFSSLGLLSTSCFLGQGLRRCGCLSPLAALPLLSIRSRDWSGDPLAQTDSERATAYSLPHQGNGQGGV